MSVDIVFPLEFIVVGVPLSSGASASSKGDWKFRIAQAAKGELQEGYWATLEPVAVTIFYFPRRRMEGDIDNIAKPILDALCQLVYMDDHQVERIIMQKFEPDRFVPFSNPSPRLAEALEREEPLVYIRIDDDVSRGF